MTVNKRTRYEVLKRDNFTCRYCRSSENPITVDHVTPVALGGSDDPDNLVAACRDCNYGKASVPPDAPLVDDVAQDAVRWAAAIAEFSRIQAADRRKRDNYVRRFVKAWEKWTFGYDKEPIPLPPDWKATIWKFHSVGFPVAELEDAVEIACGNSAVHVDNTFRYFCGVVWRKIDQMHDGAKSLLEVETTDGP